MQVQVADVGAVVARPAQADLRVQVGAVQVDLPAVAVDDGADLADARLEHAVGRGIGHHQRRQVLCVFLGLGAQVGQVDVAGLVAGHGDDAHARHDRGRGVRAVGRRRDEAHVALGLTVIVFIIIVGVPPRWAIAIGIFTGASNVIPYMGFAAAMIGGLAYALLAEDIHPLIPLVTAETFAIWVLAAVVLAELLKNVLYEPIILGGAVKLHPLVVVIGVVGGAMLFGPAGMFLAIPTITIVKVLVASSARHLKAYGLV